MRPISAKEIYRQALQGPQMYQHSPRWAAAAHSSGIVHVLGLAIVNPQDVLHIVGHHVDHHHDADHRAGAHHCDADRRTIIRPRDADHHTTIRRNVLRRIAAPHSAVHCTADHGNVRSRTAVPHIAGLLADTLPCHAVTRSEDKVPRTGIAVNGFAALNTEEESLLLHAVESFVVQGLVGTKYFARQLIGRSLCSESRLQPADWMKSHE
jgi:hypothetical protein